MLAQFNFWRDAVDKLLS